MSISSKSEKFGGHEVRQIVSALEEMGVYGALYGRESGSPWMFYLPCGRPVFELALVSLREMAERLIAEDALVTVTWTEPGGKAAEDTERTPAAVAAASDDQREAGEMTDREDDRAVVDAEWRGTTRCRDSGDPVLLLKTPSGRLRLRLSPKSARDIVETGAEQWLQARRSAFHSERSSGSPHLDGSPQDGQDVYPPTRSSSACCGEKYEPSESPSKQGCHLPSIARLISNVPHLLSKRQNTCMSFLLNFAQKRGIVGQKANSVKGTGRE